MYIHVSISVLLLLCVVQLSVTVTDEFVNYLRTSPIMLEVFGHYQQHPLHRASTEQDLKRSELLSFLCALIHALIS